MGHQHQYAPKITPGSALVCKIFPVGSAFVAIAGLDHDSGRRFDSKVLAQTAFESGKTFGNRVRQAEHSVSKAARIEMIRLRREDHDEYEFAKKNNSNVVDLLFVAVEKRIPRLAARRFHWDDRRSSVSITSKIDCPGRECPEGFYFLKMGEVSEVDKFFNSPSRPTLNVELLAELIRQQSEATPQDVSMPVTILQVDAKGARWVVNDVGCPPVR